MWGKAQEGSNGKISDFYQPITTAPQYSLSSVTASLYPMCVPADFETKLTMDYHSHLEANTWEKQLREIDWPSWTHSYSNPYQSYFLKDQLNNYDMIVPTG